MRKISLISKAKYTTQRFNNLKMKEMKRRKKTKMMMDSIIRLNRTAIRQ